jgi:hypothetical protein
LKLPQIEGVRVQDVAGIREKVGLSQSRLSLPTIS